jgi:hypothetical protein
VHPPMPGQPLLWQQSTLRDGLITALMLDVFHRHADKGVMATLAETWSRCLLSRGAISHSIVREQDTRDYKEQERLAALLNQTKRSCFYCSLPVLMFRYCAISLLNILVFWHLMPRRLAKQYYVRALLLLVFARY